MDLDGSVGTYGESGFYSLRRSQNGCEMRIQLVPGALCTRIKRSETHYSL